MIQINFEEALERTRHGENVYVLDVTSNKPTLRLFKRLTIDEAVKNENKFVLQVVEEAGK
jgi:hypothetical protein